MGFVFKVARKQISNSEGKQKLIILFQLSLIALLVIMYMCHSTLAFVSVALLLTWKHVMRDVPPTTIAS